MALKKRNKLNRKISGKMTILILVDLFDVIVTSRRQRVSLVLLTLKRK